MLVCSVCPEALISLGAEEVGLGFRRSAIRTVVRISSGVKEVARRVAASLMLAVVSQIGIVGTRRTNWLDQFSGV